jgi:hypothetical protein
MGFGFTHRPGRNAALLAAVVLGAAAVSAAAPAAGAASVRAQPQPAAGTALDSELYGVSCPSASACIAAGDEVTSAGASVALTEHWNGTAWSVLSTPAPNGSAASYLNGVSCISASACTAVGHYVSNTGMLTLIERWNGSSWSIQSSPNPSGATAGDLNDVSCVSASACTAVGHYLNSAGTYQLLAEGWNGTAWSILSVPAPGGATSGYLEGVSCVSASACIGTGVATISGASTALAEGWNGTAWSVQSVPAPSGATATELYRVSCTSASACIAAGNYASGAGATVPLAENWNGTSWSVQSTPVPSGALASYLDGVSCTSATACTAVGWYEPSAGAYETLAERWTGTTWTIQSTPNPTSATDSYLFAASCTSTPTCTAVGYDLTTGYASLAEGWDGTAWTLKSTPNP